MTVYVATWGMDYEPDEIVAVALDETDARRVLEERAARHVGAAHARLTLDWQTSRDGGSHARVFDLYTAGVTPHEVIA